MSHTLNSIEISIHLTLPNGSFPVKRMGGFWQRYAFANHYSFPNTCVCTHLLSYLEVIGLIYYIRVAMDALGWLSDICYLQKEMVRWGKVLMAIVFKSSWFFRHHHHHHPEFIRNEKPWDSPNTSRLRRSEGRPCHLLHNRPLGILILTQIWEQLD